MNFIYIAIVAILMGETESFVEDTTSIKIVDEQRTLLRKLQNFQDPKDEAKALTWNEMLAEVLVNRIEIFSSNKVNENEIIKEYSEPSKTKKVLVSCFSEVLLIYKNCIYDKWTWRYEEPDYTYLDTTSQPGFDVKTDFPDIDGPKGEIEIIEPKYHGKMQENDLEEDREKKECPEGNTKDASGDCVKENSRLLVSVPNQCPSGYRPDRLGNCRMVFY